MTSADLGPDWARALAAIALGLALHWSWTTLKRARLFSPHRIAMWNALSSIVFGVVIMAALGFAIIIITEAVYGWP